MWSECLQHRSCATRRGTWRILARRATSTLPDSATAGREYEKSLKTTRKADAEAAMHAVERATHGLTTGMLHIPPGVDPGDFIISGGTLKQAARGRQRIPVLASLIDEYLASQGHKAPSTAYTEGVHLRNLKRK